MKSFSKRAKYKKTNFDFFFFSLQMSTDTPHTKLPHFFLFKDLHASQEEAKKILQDPQNNELYSKKTVQSLAKHYLTLFEILEFVHEYTPDFFVINKINDAKKEIICFASKEFSKTFELKENPEGKNLLALMTKKEEQIFTTFIETEIQKGKKQYRTSKKDYFEISVKSDNLELPVQGKHHTHPKIFEIHIRLIGEIKKEKGTVLFDGYSIIVGRDTTDAAIQKQIAESFTNIPNILHHEFYYEAFRRKVLTHKEKNILLKNIYVITGFSDISNSAELRLQAHETDKKKRNHETIQTLNKKIEKLNHSLHDIWEKEKHQIEAIHPGVFLLEETDGLDYTICFPNEEGQKLTKQQFLSIREKELNIMISLIQKSKQFELSLKHLIIAHSKKVDFYFEEKFENCFKVATQSVDLFIKKKRLEKAKEKGTTKRITQEESITIAVDNDTDFSFYKKLLSQYQKEQRISDLYIGDVEELPGVSPIRFLRGKIT